MQEINNKNILKNGKISGFTLVELIVVITILAILGTIAFISLQGYSKQARDSTRVSDLSNIKTSLELFQLDAGKYPNPTNIVNITYSGSTVWSQGNFGETVFANLSKLDKIPVDPVSDKQYTYSITSNKIEYQLGGIMEGDSISMNNEEGIMNDLASSPMTRGELRGVSAGNLEAIAYVVGNYNGLLTKSLSGTLCNVLSVPSIITNNTSSGTDLQQIVTNKSFVYRGYKNLPSSFKDSKFKNDGGFDFAPSKLLAYSDTGSCNDLTSSSNSGTTARVGLLKGLQDSYTGSLLLNEGEIKNILALNIDTNNPEQKVVNFANSFVNSKFNTNLSITSDSNQTTVNSEPSCNFGETLTNGNCYDPYWNNVILMMHMDGSSGSTSFVDSSNYARTISRYGNPVIKTNQSYLGGSSAYFNGTNTDHLELPSSFGTELGNVFTIEFYAWIDQLPTTLATMAAPEGKRWDILGQTGNGGAQENVIWYTNYKHFGYFKYPSSTISMTGSGTYEIQSWHHVALTSDGTKYRLFVDGNMEGEVTNSQNWYNQGTPFTIGRSINPSYPDWESSMNGYIDEIRITKGVARYTASFPKPTKASGTEYFQEGSGYFSGNAGKNTGFKKSDGTVFQSCKDYNLNATTMVDGTARGSGICGDGTKGCLSDGYYSIDPELNGTKYVVYCDMHTNGGGWTRINSSLANSTIAFGSDDKISGNNVGESCGGPNYNFKISNQKLTNYTDMYYDLERTSTIVQCARITSYSDVNATISSSGSSYYYNTTNSSWTLFSPGVCAWTNPWTISTSVNVSASGLPTKWRSFLNSTSAGSKSSYTFKSTCSMGSDNGTYYMQFYVR